MQSCLEYHPQHPQGSPHVTFRRYTPPHPSSLSPQPIKEEEPSGALTTASPGSGGGPAAVSVGGGSFYGSQHCYLPATKKVDSLPRLGMLGGSTPGMYSKTLVSSPAPYPKVPGLSSLGNPAPMSPNHSLPHWLSMMGEHVNLANSPHEGGVLYWNGMEKQTNISDPHNASTMHKVISCVKELQCHPQWP